MQMRDTSAKYVAVDQLSSCCVAECLRHLRQYHAEGARLFPVQISNVWDVSLGFEVREARHFGKQAGRQSPLGILPHLDALEFCIAGSPAANDAVGTSIRHGSPLIAHTALDAGYTGACF